MSDKKIIRVFPEKFSQTPDDELVFIGSPPFASLIPEADEVHVSVTFTWHRREGERLYKEWNNILPTKLGGPAFNDPGGEFTPGMYLKKGVTTTTRGCIRKCEFCFVPKREGKIRLLEIKPGHIIQDNNLMAAPMEHIRKVFEMLKTQSGVIFLGGIDVRLLNEEKAELFKGLKIECIYMAYDSEEQYKYLVRACRLLDPLKQARKACYVLVGYENDSPEKAEERLRKAYYAGCYPYMMFYRDDKGISKSAIDPAYKKVKKDWFGRQAIFMHMKIIEEGNKDFKDQLDLSLPEKGKY